MKNARSLDPVALRYGAVEVRFETGQPRQGVVGAAVSPRGQDAGQQRGPSSPALIAARRLVARMRSYPVPPEAKDPVAQALQRACATTAQNLRQALGDDGTGALLDRAFAAIEPDHPVAAQLRDSRASITSTDRISLAVQHHGADRVEAAVEAMLSTLIEILAKLIGEDMAIRMIDRDAPPAQGAAGLS